MDSSRLGKAKRIIAFSDAIRRYPTSAFCQAFCIAVALKPGSDAGA